MKSIRLCHENRAAGYGVIQAVSCVPKGAKLRPSAIFFHHHGGILPPDIFSAAVEDETDQRPAKGKGKDQYAHADLYKRAGACGGSMPEGGGIYRTAEESGYTEEGEKAAEQLFFFSESDERHCCRRDRAEERGI